MAEPTDNVNILVVDDEEVMRNLFTDLLHDRGYNVDTAIDGQRAKEKAAQAFFQAAFIDVHMPIMNGVQTLRAIKEVSPKTAIIMMDSYPDVLLDKAEEEGAITCIHKPFDIMEVLTVIKKVTGR